jgi:hypothetical protein
MSISDDSNGGFLDAATKCFGELEIRFVWDPRIALNILLMKNSARLLFLQAALLSAIFAASVWGGPESQLFANGETKTENELEKPAIDLFSYRTSYVFESDLKNDINFGKQDAWQNQFEYSHRFLLTGNLYLRAGLAYERFDFSKTDAPVPDHLQSLAGVVGIDYMHGEDVGAFIQFRPGFYTENDLDSASFDVPTTVGRIFVLRED